MKLLRIDGTTIHSGNYKSLNSLLKGAKDKSFDSVDLGDFLVPINLLPKRIRNGKFGVLTGNAFNHVFDNCKIFEINKGLQRRMTYRDCVITYTEDVNFSNCELTGTRFKSRVQGTKFTRCHLIVDMSGATIEDSLFKESSLVDCDFDDTCLYSTMLSMCSLLGTDLTKATCMKNVLVGESEVVVGNTRFVGHGKETSDGHGNWTDCV